MRVRSWVWGVLAVLVALGTAAWAADAERAQEHRRRAAEYREQGKLEEASIELRNAVQLSPRDPDGHRELAQVYLQLKDPAAAFREYQEVVSLAPEDGEARLQVATFLLLGRRYQDALEHARKAVELLPDRFEGYALVGRAKQGLKDRDGAVEAMRKAVELAPDQELLWVELARLHGAGRNLDQAAAVLREGIVKVPPSITLRVALANLLAGQKQVEEADRLIGEVENLAGGSLPAVKAVALYRLRRGDPAAAEALLKGAVRDAGDDPEARLPALAELANFYSLVGNLPEARDTLKEVRELAPDHALTLARLANLYLLEGDEDAAAPLVEALLEKAPEDRNARLLAARLDIARGEVARGTATLEAIVAEAPDSVNGNLFLGKAYATARQWEKARSAYLAVLEQVPTHFFALLDLAKVNLELGRAEAALERADQVLAVRPDNGGARRVRARALLEAGRAEDAEAALRELLEEAPDEALLHLLLGRALTARGKHEEALAALRRSGELAPRAVEPLLAQMGVLARLGRDDQLQAAAQAFLDRNGDTAPVLNALATYHLGRGERDRAAALVERSLAAADVAVTRELAARVALAGRDTRAAEAALDRALELEPGRVSALLTLAGLYETSGRGARAAELYRRVLADHPGQPVAANNLAVLYAADPEHRLEALELAQKAVEGAPDSPFTRDTLGWVQFQLGRVDSAVRNLEQARTAMPEHPEIAYHLGAAYAKQGGKDAQAVQLLKEALDAKDKGPWAFDAGQLLRELEGGGQ